MRDYGVYVLDPEILEKDFTEHVRQLARQGGWLFYHTYDARRSEPGFPDTAMVRGGVLILAELKRRKTKTTMDQDTWISALTQVANGSGRSDGFRSVEVYVWRPQDYEAIARRLLEGVPL